MDGILKRKDLIDKLNEYKKSNKYESNQYFVEYFNIIDEMFEKSCFYSNSDFCINGRRKFLVNEYYEILKNFKQNQVIPGVNDSLYFILGNLEEILMGSNIVGFDDVDKEKRIYNENGTYSVDGVYLKELMDMDSKYTKTGIICLEEKKLVEQMKNDFKDVLNFINRNE